MKASIIKNTVTRIFLAASLLTLVTCGGEDGDETNVVINPEGPQEEQVPGGGSPTVVVNNRIENNVKVKNKNINVVKNKEVEIEYTCDEVDEVVHYQYIHIGVSCQVVLNNDLNRDGYLDEAEVHQAAGPGVIALDSNLDTQDVSGLPVGRSYYYSEEIDKDFFWSIVPPGQKFLVMIYGVDEREVLPPTYQAESDLPAHLTVPITYFEFTSPLQANTAGGAEGGTATGGTAGGTTGGNTTGGTAGGTTGGNTTGGTAGGTTGGNTTGGTTGGTDTGTTTGGGTATGTTTGGGTATGTTTGGGTTTGTTTGGTETTGTATGGGDTGTTTGGTTTGGTTTGGTTTGTTTGGTTGGTDDGGTDGGPIEDPVEE